MNDAWLDPPFNTALRADRPATRDTFSIREIMPRGDPRPTVTGLFTVTYETDDTILTVQAMARTSIRRVLRVDVVAGRFVPAGAIDEVEDIGAIRFRRLSNVTFRPVGGEHLTPYRETMVDVSIERPVVETLRTNGPRVVARLEGWGTARLRLEDAG